MFIKEVRYIHIEYEGHTYRLFPNGDWQQQRLDLRGWVLLKGDEALEIQLAYEEELETRAIEEEA